MNTYPYTNYQDANLDWILKVGAELRACFDPVEVSGTDRSTGNYQIHRRNIHGRSINYTPR